MIKQSKKQNKKPEVTDQIEELNNKIKELEENYTRARADYINLEQRMVNQQAQFTKAITASIFEKFISILDNLELAAAHINDQGLKLVMDQVHKMLEDQGVVSFETKGLEFDPQTMECIDKVDGVENQVVEEVQKGFKLGNHLIRPAKVKVGQAK